MTQENDNKANAQTRWQPLTMCAIGHGKSQSQASWEWSLEMDSAVNGDLLNTPEIATT